MSPSLRSAFCPQSATGELGPQCLRIHVLAFGKRSLDTHLDDRFSLPRCLFLTTRAPFQPLQAFEVDTCRVFVFPSVRWSYGLFVLRPGNEATKRKIQRGWQRERVNRWFLGLHVAGALVGLVFGTGQTSCQCLLVPWARTVECAPVVVARSCISDLPRRAKEARGERGGEKRAKKGGHRKLSEYWEEVFYSVFSRTGGSLVVWFG